MKQDLNSLTKGEMIDYLKENLNIIIRTTIRDYNMVDVEIKLRLGEEVISSDSFNLFNQ